VRDSEAQKFIEGGLMTEAKSPGWFFQKSTPRPNDGGKREEWPVRSTARWDAGSGSAVYESALKRTEDGACRLKVRLETDKDGELPDSIRFGLSFPAARVAKLELQKADPGGTSDNGQEAQEEVPSQAIIVLKNGKRWRLSGPSPWKVQNHSVAGIPCRTVSTGASRSEPAMRTWDVKIMLDGGAEEERK
jgi:hypothetical protein